MPRLTKLTAVLTAAAVVALAAPAIALTTSGDSDSERADVARTTAAAPTAEPQAVVAGTFLFARSVTPSEPRGTRSDEQFFQISRTGSNDVPAAALAAYRRVAATMAKEQPGCGIGWTLLAAIGRVESNHGRFGGAQLSTDGVSRPAIRGPRLDGAGDFAAISDSDGGALDGDKVWDRAVGPMQFLPSTWRSVGRDGDGDGRANPDDLDDAALGAAVYLCGAGGSLAEEAGMARAAFRYNHSEYYVRLVLSFVRGYDTGVFAEPSPPPPAAAARHTHHVVRTPHHHAPATTPSPLPSSTQPTSPTPTPTGSSSPTPSSPSSPSPTPTAYDGTGTLLRDEPDEYTLQTPTGTVVLDVADTLDETALADLDGDGTIETNRAELDGLVAAAEPVHVQGTVTGTLVSVEYVDDQPYTSD